MPSLYAGHASRDFKQASARLDVGPPAASGGLRPSLLSAGAAGNIRAPQVNIHAQDVTYTPVRPPRGMVDTTLESIAGMSEVWVNEAMKYQNREAELYANDEVLKFNNFVRDNLKGTTDENGDYVEGFLDTTGRTSIEAHGAFSTAVNDRFVAMLDEMEPRVKQKALMRMAGIRDTAMGQAATHRSNQLRVAEEQQQYARKKDIVRTIAMDPDSIYRIDKVTGTDGKTQFYRQCTDPKKCDQEWYGVISEVQKTIYLEDGLDKAKRFYELTASAELSASPKHAASAMGDIRRWEHERIRAHNSTQELKLKQAKLAQQKKYDESEKIAIVLQTRGTPLTKEQIADLVMSESMDPGFASSHLKDVYGELDSLADPDVYQNYVDNLTTHARTNFIAPDGTNWGTRFMKDTRLDSTTRAELRDLRKSLQNPSYQNNYTNLGRSIDTWFAGKNWEQKVYPEKIAEKKRMAHREAQARLKSGESYGDVYDDMEQRFNTTTLQIEELPIPQWGQRPETVIDVRTALENANRNLRSGVWTQDIYDAEISMLNKYMNAFIENEPPETFTVKDPDLEPLGEVETEPTEENND